VAPGASAGRLTVGGNVMLNAATTFFVEMNGIVAGTSYRVSDLELASERKVSPYRRKRLESLWRWHERYWLFDPAQG